MGWITRRVAGYIVFAVASAVLGAIAVSQGYLTGEPTLATTCGVIIIGVAFLISFAATTRMKERDVAQKDREEWERAWRDHYARQSEQVQRAWQEYHARQRQQVQRPR